MAEDRVVDQKLITIDGPAGCGKSTVTRGLAARLNGVAFNSGCVYRAVTYGALNSDCDLRVTESVLRWVAAGHLKLVPRGAEIRVEIDGVDPGALLHTPDVTSEIHWVANAPELREAVLQCQRDIRSDAIIVAEGRDLGTVVYPNAGLKIFLTASLEVRARRRWQEWGEEHDLDSIIADIRQRDRRDQEREAAPLRAADDAVTIDTSALEVDEVIDAIEKEIPSRWHNEKPRGST